MARENISPAGQLTDLRNVEHDEVLVHVVEVPGITLVPVVGELGLAIVVAGGTVVIAVHADSFMVEQNGEDTAGFHLMAVSRLEINLGDIAELVASARALPERNFLSVTKFGVVVVERGGLKIDVGSGLKVGQHNKMLELLGSESLTTTDIEQSGDLSQSTEREIHLYGSIAQELGRFERPFCGQTLAVESVVPTEQIDTFGISGACDSPTVESVPERLTDHVIDRAHDEVIKCNRHRLINLIEKHGRECVELSGAGERLLDLHGCQGLGNLERGHLVEELGPSNRAIEHVGIIRRARGQIPALVLGCLGHLGTNLFEDRPELPAIHHDIGSSRTIAAVNVLHLADTIDKVFYPLIDGIIGENLIANIDNIAEIFLHRIFLAESLLGGLIYDLMYLRYFHFYFSFLILGKDLDT